MTFLKAAWLLTAVFTLTWGGCKTAPAPKANPPKPAAQPKVTTSDSPAALPKGVLFDGKSLAGWEITDFAGRGEITVTNGEIRVGLGHMTGINLKATNDLPRTNYELSLDAMRVDGSDFFCGLTFPVGKEHCSFIIGGWGGGVVGLSSLNHDDASQNETTSYMNFANNKWFHIRLRVQPDRIQAWIDNDRVVNVDLTDKQVGLRIEMESSTPLGLATWNTAAAWKNIQLKKL